MLMWFVKFFLLVRVCLGYFFAFGLIFGLGMWIWGI